MVIVPAIAAIDVSGMDGALPAGTRPRVSALANGFAQPLFPEAGGGTWAKALRLGRRVQNMIRAALTTAGVERTRIQSAISQGSQQRLTQVRCRVMRGGDGHQHGANYTGLRLETRVNSFYKL
jgi:hypothetical protein